MYKLPRKNIFKHTAGLSCINVYWGYWWQIYSIFLYSSKFINYFKISRKIYGIVKGAAKLKTLDCCRSDALHLAVVKGQNVQGYLPIIAVCMSFRTFTINPQNGTSINNNEHLYYPKINKTLHLLI